MSYIPDMTPTSLMQRLERLAQVKLLKMASVFLKKEKICYKIVYYAFICVKPKSEIGFKS